jgi:hypothetical protein
MKKTLLYIIFCLISLNSLKAQVTNWFPEMLVGKWKIYSTTDTINPIDGIFDAIMVSKGVAVYSTYKTADYEANALWCFDRVEKIQYSLETKSNGLVWIHKGEVIDIRTLILRRYSKEKPEELIQETTMKWISDNKILITLRSLRANEEWSEREFYYIK